MMGGHRVATQPFRQMMGHTLCQTASIHEDQR